MKSKKFVWIAAAILLAGMISSCEELGVDGIEDLFPLTPVPTPAGNNVEFTGVEADGYGGNPTTALTLHFNAVLSGLSKDDITLTPGDGVNINKVELTGDGPSYTLYVDGVDTTGDVDVGVNMAKKGYIITGGPIKVTVYGEDNVPRKVVFSGLAADGGTTGTKSLTLTFDTAVTGLTSDNIELDKGSTGAGKGNLEGEGKSWRLYVSNITTSGDVEVEVSKDGYVFEPSTKTAAILAPATGGGEDGGQTTGTGTEVAFTGAQADGGGGYATTALSLHFSKAITELSAGDITLDSIGEANKSITKGTLAGVGPSYTLTVSGVAVEGFVKVSVSKSGYAVSGNPRTVAVHTAESGGGAGGSDTKTAIPVEFTSLSSNGVAGNTATTFLTLTFNTKVEGLVSENIHLNEGGTGAVKGTLTGGGTSYNLGVSGVDKGGNVSVTVTKTGYAFNPTTKAATVYSGQNSDNNGGSDVPGGPDNPDNSDDNPAPPDTPNTPTPVTLTNVTAADGKSSTATTTVLKITFNNSVIGLTACNISITNGTGEAVKNGALGGSGKEYSLPVSVTKQGTVSVEVSSPAGYNITPASIIGVQVYFKPTPESAKKDPMLPVTENENHSTEFISVDGTLYEVHTFKSAYQQYVFFVSMKDRKPAKIDVLVVGGGGSGGYRADGKPSAGGGAGGCVYYPDLSIEDIGNIAITVGKGGKVEEQSAGNGGESKILITYREGSEKTGTQINNYITAYGGKGATGATGGASGEGQVLDDKRGTPKFISTSHAGGSSGIVGSEYENSGAITAGSGGGATGAGNQGPSLGIYNQAFSGTGYTSSIRGGSVRYAKGGQGGAASPLKGSNTGDGGAGAANTGDGGGGGSTGSGLAGGSGVVIVRWPYVAAP